MNAQTSPICIACLFHPRCGNCYVEAHKVRGSDPEPTWGWNQQVPVATTSPEKETASFATASSAKPTERAESPVMPTWDVGPVLSNSEWYSYSLTAVIASKQLGILQDLSLSDSKTLEEPDPDAGMSDTRDKAAILMELQQNLKCAKEGDDDQTSSDDPTPNSEAWEFWEEIPELDGSNIDGDVFLKVFKSPLDMLFKEWLGGIYCQGGDGASGSSSSSFRSHQSGQQQPTSKRRRIENVENDDREANSKKLRTTEKQSRKLTPLHKLLACPYFKTNSRHHEACAGFGAKKLSYVKSHIYKKHAIAIYCPVCQQTFENVRLRDSHTRDRNCEPDESAPTPDGITSEQRNWLHQRGPRDLTEEEQWYRIFKFLFPGHKRPHSPYNDTAYSEDLLNFRDFISQPTAREILLQRLRENVAWTSELELIFRPDLEHGLDQLYAGWVATRHIDSGQIPARESPLQDPEASTQSMAGDRSNSGTGSETRVDEQNDPSVPEHAPEHTPRNGATLDVMDDLIELELEERKIDESDQMPPRQLNHDGIALVPNQPQWLPAELPEADDMDYGPLNLDISNDINEAYFEMGDAFLNPFDGQGGVDPRQLSLDLGFEEPLSFEAEGYSRVHEPLEGLRKSFAEGVAASIDKGKETDPKN